jgi:hypothetical protein
MFKNRSSKFVYILVVVTFFITACGPAVASTPIQPVSSATPNATNTSIPTVTPTSTPDPFAGTIDPAILHGKIVTLKRYEVMSEDAIRLILDVGGEEKTVLVNEYDFEAVIVENGISDEDFDKDGFPWKFGWHKDDPTSGSGEFPEGMVGTAYYTYYESSKKISKISARRKRLLLGYMRWSMVKVSFPAAGIRMMIPHRMLYVLRIMLYRVRCAIR